MPCPAAAASSGVSLSSIGIGFVNYPTAIFVSAILWPVWRVVDMIPKVAFGMGLPSGSMVMPFMIPFSDALTPVANSPMTSLVAPRASYFYY